MGVSGVWGRKSRILEDFGVENGGSLKDFP